MIKTPKHLEVTRKQLSQLKESIARAVEAGVPEGYSKEMFDIQIGGMSAIVSSMEEDIAAYERLARGDTSGIELNDWPDLPRALIQHRIAKGISQAELARRLNVKSQQVQRWEAMNNNTISYEMLCSMALVLDVKFPMAKTSEATTTKGANPWFAVRNEEVVGPRVPAVWEKGVLLAGQRRFGLLSPTNAAPFGVEDEQPARPFAEAV